ncbi:three-Cys-motif partner protein TcmP [Sorangium sp. So ce388]|uniref:three-Cys-motif partner protein TcmP n=1 Tax=Sorangium sp. So ce388 TaxID=3133309 RepID=UPI003F5C2AF8
MAKYDWSDGPATLGPHSLAKHEILREYIERYIPILTRSGTVPLKLMLIDGFAGGGEYVVEGHGSTLHPGSPLILINAVRAAEARMNAVVGRKKPFSVDASYVFIEKNPTTYAYLDATLKRHVGESFVRDKVDLRCGAFEEELGSILDRIKGTTPRRPRPIFVLDQYGYRAIPVDLIKRIMTEIPRAEVFLTLAVDHISAHAKTAGDALSRLRDARLVEPELEAFLSGRRDMDEAATLSSEDRGRLMRLIQFILHETFAKRAHAECYTPFFITSKRSHRSYWFLHLANSSKANDVVKALHWSVSNHFEHFGREGTMMLGFDPTKNKDQTVLPFPFEFDDSAKARTVRALIEELPVIFHARHHDGVSLKVLYKTLCNETPADLETLGDAVNRLCGDLELEKRGANGEEREVSTKVKDSDIIRPARQGRLFRK